MSKGMRGKRPGFSYDRKPDFYGQLSGSKVISASKRRLRRRAAKLNKNAQSPPPPAPSGGVGS